MSDCRATSRGRAARFTPGKEPVAGRCRAEKLNLAGDGQGDLAGHGSEQRAVYVYQIDSYRYWQERLGRNDFRVRFQPEAGDVRAGGGPSVLLRSYALSGPPSRDRYRISVKIEPHGAAGIHIREHVRVGGQFDISAPRGNFVLQDGERPIVRRSGARRRLQRALS